MMIENLADKKSARSAAANIRKVAHDVARVDAPMALAARGLPFSPASNFKVVSAFFPYQSEIDTRPLLGRLAGDGWTTALPIVIALNEPLIFRRWLPGEPTVAGMWNIPQPTEESPLLEPDVLLVPLLSFDRQGYRLGYGGGFYDRTIELYRSRKKIKAIGVAYAAQEVLSVPHDRHDQRLDGVLSEREYLAF